MVPMLGASTVAHTSPSVTALPPDQEVELVDVDSAQEEWSLSQHKESIHDGTPSEDGRFATDRLGGCGCAGDSVRHIGY